MKQAPVKQGMYREQENSHLEWPDYNIQSNINRRKILVKKKCWGSVLMLDGNSTLTYTHKK